MLFHLFSPSANAYVTFPTGGGTSFGLSTRPMAGTVIDMCGERGNSISRGLYINGPGDGFVSMTDEAGHETLKHNDIVTMRDPGTRFIVPRDTNIRLERAGFGSARFRIKRVAGNGRIRHGDMVGLGALLPGDPNRYRWLEANPTGQPVKLGGISRIFGGQSQQFRFLEGNIVLGRADLAVSDKFPGEDRPTGALRVMLSHEGLPNGSALNVRFTALAAQSFNFNSGAVHAPTARGQNLSVTVPAGSREVSVPLACVSPLLANGCARIAAVFAPGARATRRLGELTIVDSGMAAWDGAATGHQGTRPRAIDIMPVAAEDFMRVTIDGTAMGNGADGLQFVGNHGLTVRVQRGSRVLPPSTRGYAIAVSLSPFPAAGFATTATTPVPATRSGAGGALTVSRGRFVHNATFAPFTPRSSRNCYCLTVLIVTQGNVMGASPHYVRSFGIIRIG